MIESFDTVFAPSSAIGGAISVIRVSGGQACAIAQKLLDRPVWEQPNQMRHTRILRGGQPVDDCMAVFFKAPKSYTGEDMLELHCHGGMTTVRCVLAALSEAGGVPAGPGEFTRRAFLNGKMDLSQAESVADVIHSANRAELKNAHRLLSGALSKKVKLLTEQIKDISARLELDVDFAEEEADPDYAGWEGKLAAIRGNVESILKSFRSKASVSRIPLAVLYGAPNAGKSSLVNALLGEDRILVSSVPGTTRDFVEVRLFLAGGEIRLVDTAGIAATATDALDALSMQKSREVLEEADLKICVVDGSLPVADAEQEFNPDLVVLSKQDLVGGLPNAEGISLAAPSIAVSAKTGYGLEELSKEMNARLFKSTENTEDLWITSEREKACLEEALKGIDRALDLIRTSPAVELLAFEMQLVRRSLQSITGEISSEDILQSIFAGFCIGK